MQRFLSKIDIPSDRNKCWNWLASKKKPFAYGQFCVSGKMELAHRVSFTYFNDDIPEGQMVLHKCDNPSCVNPAHLFLGTQLDNMKDMTEKGRHKSPNREKLFCRKGHEYAGENLYVDSLGKRYCRTCRKANIASYKERR